MMINTHRALYQCNVLLFGVKCALVRYRLIVNTVFGDLSYVTAFIFSGTSANEHRTHFGRDHWSFSVCLQLEERVFLLQHHKRRESWKAELKYNSTTAAYQVFEHNRFRVSFTWHNCSRFARFSSQKYPTQSDSHADRNPLWLLVNYKVLKLWWTGP